jgi:LuxR family maltose regulon positive regulatory protein
MSAPAQYSHSSTLPPGSPPSSTAVTRTALLNDLTLLEAKLSPPALRSPLVRRDVLLPVLAATNAAVVVVRAPAGYGKTTLLSQFAASTDLPVAWLTLDESDADPAQLLVGIATALDRCAPLEPRVVQALVSPTPDPSTDMLPGLMNSLAHGPACALILDDVQRVMGHPGERVVAYLCEHLPTSVRLLLAGRQLAALPLWRLRARGMLLEFGPAELSLSQSEARQLFDGVGRNIASSSFESLYEQTEGWPAGIYLGALATSTAADPDAAARAFDGADPTIRDFLSVEQLAGEAPDRRAFLQRTSVLGRLSAPLCDAVLGRDDSAAVLCAMEQSNGFVIALDRRRQWYRYHHLFSQALQEELAQTAAGEAREIHVRASRWYAAQGNHAAAIEHAVHAHDEHRVAELMCGHLQALFAEVDQATLCRWLEALSDAALTEHPPLAVAGAWLMFQLGDLEKTGRYMRVLDGPLVFDAPCPLGEVSAQSAVALLKAALGWDGVSRIGKHAEVVRGLEPAVSRTYRLAGLYLGASLFLQERRAAARDLLEDAADVAPTAVDLGVIAQALLVLLDLEERRTADAEARISRSLTQLDCAGLQECLALAPLLAAQAWVDLARNECDSARAHLRRAAAMLPRALVMPWLATYLQIVLGRLALELDEVEFARALPAAARRGLMRHPDAGMLPHMLASVERAYEAAQGGGRTLLEPLTQAELRVLELAPTCLSIEEIGRTLCVSKNTVKTHLKAIYAKLAVASRSEAVERARGLRLIG